MATSPVSCNRASGPFNVRSVSARSRKLSLRYKRRFFPSSLKSVPEPVPVDNCQLPLNSKGAPPSSPVSERTLTAAGVTWASRFKPRSEGMSKSGANSASDNLITASAAGAVMGPCTVPCASRRPVNLRKPPISRAIQLKSDMPSDAVRSTCPVTLGAADLIRFASVGAPSH